MKITQRLKTIVRPFRPEAQAGIVHHLTMIVAVVVLVAAVGSFFTLQAGATKLDGAIVSGYRNKCLTAPSHAANGSAVTLQSCGNDSETQAWQTANGDQSIRIQGLCLGLANAASGAQAVLATCKGSSFEQWTAQSGGLLNVQAGTCLAVSNSTNGTDAKTATCSMSTGQRWVLQNSDTSLTGARGSIRSSLTNSRGLADFCMDDQHNSTDTGAVVQLATCNNKSSQAWTVYSDATIRIHNVCLAVSGNAQTAGAPVSLAACANHSSEAWVKGAHNAIVNVASGRCLTSPGADSGAQLQIQPCSASANQSWTTPTNSAQPIASQVVTANIPSATESAAVQTAEQHDLQYLITTFKPTCSEVKSTFAKQTLHC